MGLRQISQEEYNNRQQEIVTTAHQLVAAARDQLSFIRSVQDQALRKTLVTNEKGVYAIIKQLYTLTLRNSRVCVKRDASPNMKSGFAMQKAISAAMSAFASNGVNEGWEPGALKSRNEVTRIICDYVKKNGLNDPDDKRKIVPDEHLAALIGTTDTVTYNHIQSVLGKVCFKTS